MGIFPDGLFSEIRGTGFSGQAWILSVVIGPGLTTSFSVVVWFKVSVARLSYWVTLWMF